eukprot:PLAT138.1.p1 GENE.PLAT138.1~~PLAT138.1.p1  ORF type:complete len:687 (-),score=271.45 PLAT138.1:106-1863(-)
MRGTLRLLASDAIRLLQLYYTGSCFGAPSSTHMDDGILAASTASTIAYITVGDMTRWQQQTVKAQRRRMLDVAHQLRTYPPFARLGGKSIVPLVRACRQRSFRFGASVFSQGQRFTSAFLLLSGEVQLSVSADGDGDALALRHLARLRPPVLLGLSEYLKNSGCHLHTATALSEQVVVLQMGLDVLNRLPLGVQRKLERLGELKHVWQSSDDSKHAASDSDGREEEDGDAADSRQDKQPAKKEKRRFRKRKLVLYHPHMYRRARLPDPPPRKRPKSPRPLSASPRGSLYNAHRFMSSSFFPPHPDDEHMAAAGERDVFVDGDGVSAGDDGYEAALPTDGGSDVELDDDCDALPASAAMPVVSVAFPLADDVEEASAAEQARARQSMPIRFKPLHSPRPPSAGSGSAGKGKTQLRTRKRSRRQRPASAGSTPFAALEAERNSRARQLEAAARTAAAHGGRKTDASMRAVAFRPASATHKRPRSAGGRVYSPVSSPRRPATASALSIHARARQVEPRRRRMLQQPRNKTSKPTAAARSTKRVRPRSAAAAPARWRSLYDRGGARKGRKAADVARLRPSSASIRGWET